MKKLVMPCFACQSSSRSLRPPAAQADLDVAAPGRRGPARRGCTSACRGSDSRPKSRAAVSVWVSKWTSPTGPARCSAHARTSGSAIEWSPPSTIGTAPAPSTSATVSSIARWERDGIGRDDRSVAVVDDAQHRRASRSLALEVIRRRRRCRADRPRAEARSRQSETRSSIGAPTTATSTPAAPPGPPCRAGRRSSAAPPRRPLIEAVMPAPALGRIDHA